MGLIAPLKSAGSVFGIRTHSETDFQTMLMEDPFEIRKYHPYMVAKTTVSGEFEEATELAFDMLSDFLYGQNTQRIEIPMVAPVWIERAETGWTMSFVMSDKYNLETVPKPFNPRITFEKRSAHHMAVLRYSGYSDELLMRDQEKKLQEWLRGKRQYVTASRCCSAQYDSALTLPFLRRNEIQIRVLPMARG